MSSSLSRCFHVKLFMGVVELELRTVSDALCPICRTLTLRGQSWRLLRAAVGSTSVSDVALRALHRSGRTGTHRLQVLVDSTVASNPPVSTCSWRLLSSRPVVRVDEPGGPSESWAVSGEPLMEVVSRRQTRSLGTWDDANRQALLLNFKESSRAAHAKRTPQSLSRTAGAAAGTLSGGASAIRCQSRKLCDKQTRTSSVKICVVWQGWASERCPSRDRFPSLSMFRTSYGSSHDCREQAGT